MCNCKTERCGFFVCVPFVSAQKLTHMTKKKPTYIFVYIFCCFPGYLLNLVLPPAVDILVSSTSVLSLQLLSSVSDL